jgi:hypothetical protein
MHITRWEGTQEDKTHAEIFRDNSNLQIIQIHQSRVRSTPNVLGIQITRLQHTELHIQYRFPHRAHLSAWAIQSHHVLPKLHMAAMRPASQFEMC